MKKVEYVQTVRTFWRHVGVIKQAKQNTGLKSKDLAKFLEVAEPTLYYWQKKDIWPSWALKKCGVIEEVKASKAELLTKFFKYFRDNGEKFIGITIEELVERFLNKESGGEK